MKSVGHIQMHHLMAIESDAITRSNILYFYQYNNHLMLLCFQNSEEMISLASNQQFGAVFKFHKQGY